MLKLYWSVNKIILVPWGVKILKSIWSAPSDQHVQRPVRKPVSNSTKDAQLSVFNCLSVYPYVMCFPMWCRTFMCFALVILHAFKRQNSFTSATMNCNVQHIHFQMGKKHKIFFLKKKKKGLVKYKILLLFRSVIAAAVFEIFIFLLYIMNNMDSGHTALTPLPFFGDCHKYFRIRGFILICLIQIIFIFGKTKSE